MPLKGIKVSDSVKRITFKDYLPFKYEITDADIKYPVAVFKNFCKYVNSKYKAGVWGDQFLNKGDSSIVTLVYYVPIKFTKEEIESDVKAFENQYEDLKIEIKINTPQQEFNTYTDFKKGLLNQPWNLELAKKLFRLNWHSEPNLDDPDDQEELLILFNMNQESYHEYYVVDATMYFNIPDFAKNRIGEKNIDLHVYHVGDSKMNLTKEQIKKINEIYENAIDPNYNPSDPFLALSDQAYPYLISTANWSDFKNLLDQFYYGTEDDKVTYYDVLGVNNFEDVKKMSPKNIIDKIGKYDYEEGGDFLEFWGENTSDKIYKLIENEMDDEYLTEDNLNQIHDIIFNHSEKIKGDSKMKKDEDPRLELVDNIKNYMLVRHYDLNDKFIAGCIDERFLDSFNKKEIIDSLIESLENWYESEDENFNEECIQKLKNNPSDEFIFKLHQMIWGKENPEIDVENFLYYNTVENLKKIYSKYAKGIKDNLTNDSKQQDICDSFSKRYHTLIKDMPRLASIKRSAEVPLFLGYYNKGLVNDYNKSLEALIADLEYDLINFKNSSDYNSNIRNELKENYRPVYNICQKSTINPNLQNQFVQLYKNI